MSEPSKLTAWERWELASFDEAQAAPQPAPLPVEDVAPALRLPTAEEIDRLYQQARDEGLKKGKEEGFQAGFKEGQTKALAEAQRLNKAATKLEKSLDDLDFLVADELLALAVELAREVIREEITARPETLLTVVREALAQLPHQHAAIYLHPDDASLLRSYMGDQLAHSGNRIHEDFKLARGDCVLEAGGSQIDATVGMRWQRVLQGLGISSAWQSTPPLQTPLRDVHPPGGEGTLGVSQRVSSEAPGKDEP
jgi:flagellar assembly protein FliH